MKTTYTYILSIAAGLLFTLEAYSQGSVTYRVTKDDPYDVKNFSLAIDPLFFDVNGQNGYAFGWGMRADYLMGKRLQWNFDMRNGFGTKGYNINDKNTRNYTAYEGTIGLVLRNKVKTRNLPIILSQSSYSSGGYTYTRTVSIKGGVPAKIRRLTMLQGGAYLMGNSVKYDLLNDSLVTFEKDATTFSFKDSASALNAYGATAATVFFGGFNFKKIHQLIVDVDGYGLRANKRYSDFFIHAMFAPILTMKNYEHNGVKYNVKYDNKKLIGWRMGWMYRQPKDQGFSVKFEFGQRPLMGTKSETPDKFNFTDMYAMFTYGLYVPLRVKPIAEEE